MLTKTSESAIKLLIFLTLQKSDLPLSPRYLAEMIDESPSYLAKITQMLVKAGILRAHRGVSGGVTLVNDSRQITLFAIVEACQGKILGNYCDEVEDLSQVCPYHKAMYEVYQATIQVLQRWTLADLAAPFKASRNGHENCRMGGICLKVRKVRGAPR